MAIGSVNTGGGGLNFKIVGGITQPPNPSENMIWVNTSTGITDWVFSATQPEGEEGRIWVNTANASSAAFDAVKKDGLWVYPRKCSQYIGGVWTYKTAMTYQNGAWKNWTSYLYNLGDSCLNITGGWAKASGLSYCGYYNYGSVVFRDADIQFVVTSSGFTAISTVNAIDLTEYSTLKVNVTSFVINTAGLTLKAEVTPSLSGALENISIALAYTTTTGILSLPIGNITGNKYITLYTEPRAGSVTMDKIWLE